MGAPDLVPPANLAPAVAPGTPLTITAPLTSTPPSTDVPSEPSQVATGAVCPAKFCVAICEVFVLPLIRESGYESALIGAGPPYTWLTGWVNCDPPPECTKLPPWVTLVTSAALLLRRVRMSFPDPWMTAPMLLAAVHGASPPRQSCLTRRVMVKRRV